MAGPLRARPVKQGGFTSGRRKNERHSRSLRIRRSLTYEPWPACVLLSRNIWQDRSVANASRREVGLAHQRVAMQYIVALEFTR